MNKHLIVIGTAVLLLAVGLSGCFDSNEDKIVGTWIGTLGNESDPANVEYTYFSDNTCSAVAYYKYETTQVTGTWKIINNKLVITSEDGEISTNDYQFSNNDKTLTLENTKSNSTIVLTRK